MGILHLCTFCLVKIRVCNSQALRTSRIEPASISSVEIVGSCTRVPAVHKMIEDFFQRAPSRTLNYIEVVARGCALQCAMLSPAFKVRDFNVIDAVPYGIAVSYEKDGIPTKQVRDMTRS